MTNELTVSHFGLKCLLNVLNVNVNVMTAAGSGRHTTALRTAAGH